MRPPLALAPYPARYRTKTIAALVALTAASLATLVVLVAVAVLALTSAFRVYLVTTLGEQIVADLRRDVFSPLTSPSPAFFDSAAALTQNLVPKTGSTPGWPVWQLRHT